MVGMLSPRLLGLLLCAAALACRPGAVQGEPVPALVLETLDGTRVAPLETPSALAVCLVFVAPDCPIANAYAPEIERIARAYGPRRVACYLVYADAWFTAEDARRHGAEFHLSLPALLDPEGRLARFVGATITPEAAVWSPHEGLVYRGRIDDRYVDFGKKRAEPGERDLRAALDAVLAGKRPPVARTRAVGCFLPVHDATARSGEGASPAADGSP